MTWTAYSLKIIMQYVWHVATQENLGVCLTVPIWTKERCTRSSVRLISHLKRRTRGPMEK
jgi:cobalamin biosynthesis Mg chelatase CobN